MAPPEPPTTITLKVKVPPGSQIAGGRDEFALGSIETNATIAQLRQRIQQLVPSHPLPETQRLLYFGRNLGDNNQTVADALNIRRDPTQTDYVVHLIVKGDGMSAGPSPGPASGSSARLPQHPTQHAPAPQPAQHPQGPQIDPNLAHVHAQSRHHHQNAHQQEHLRQVQLQQQAAMQQVLAQAQRAGAMLPLAPLAGGIPLPPAGIFPGFGQAVAQGQQQRAAAGMPGVGGQPNAAAQQPNQPNVNVRITTTTIDVRRPLHRQPRLHGQQPQQAETQPQPHAQGQTPASQPEQQANRQQPQPNRAPGGQSFTLPDGRRVTIAQAAINIPQLGIEIPIQNIMPQIRTLLEQRAGAQGAPTNQAHPPPAQQPQQPQSQQRPAQPAAPAAAQPTPPTTALDRARENMSEMRRMLDEMRNSTTASEEQRTRIADLQERAQNLNDYIDPFSMGGQPADSGRRSAPPNVQAQRPPGGRPPFIPPHLLQRPNRPPVGPPPHMFPQPPPFFTPQHPQFPTPFPPVHPQAGAFMSPPHLQNPPAPSDATCYLFSSPQGPQALLFSPQHGTYTSTLARTPLAGLTPTPTIPLQQAQQVFIGAGQQLLDQQARQAPGGDAVAAAAAAMLQNAQQQNGGHVGNGNNAGNGAVNANQDPIPLGGLQQQPQQQQQQALQALANHMWLLLRILIFAYFLLGANMGWRRPAALLVIGLGFWMVRMGLFGEGGVARRWWEEVVGVPQQQGQAQLGAEGQPNQAPGEQAAAPQGQQHGAGNGRGMPTPEQLAQRLLNERREAQNQRLQRVRELVRPVERAVALFVASLWPGVGEAAVRAREEEERRRNEAEVEARRREQEERERLEREKAEKDGEGKDGPATGGEGGASTALEKEAEAKEEVVAERGGGEGSAS
jgi:hypothetical protein